MYFICIKSHWLIEQTKTLIRPTYRWKNLAFGFLILKTKYWEWLWKIIRASKGSIKYCMCILHLLGVFRLAHNMVQIIRSQYNWEAKWSLPVFSRKSQVISPLCERQLLTSYCEHIFNTVLWIIFVATANSHNMVIIIYVCISFSSKCLPRESSLYILYIYKIIMEDRINLYKTNITFFVVKYNYNYLMIQFYRT